MKTLLISVALLFSSCILSYRTGYYIVRKVEVTGQHSLLYIYGLKYPIEHPTCNLYKPNDSIYLDFSYKKSLFK